MVTLCWPALVPGCLLGCLLGCLGCQQVWLVAPESPEGSGSPAATRTAQQARTAKLEHTKRLLERRLDAVEERLARSRGAGDAGDELRDERLVLTVALMLIEQDIAEAQRGERGEMPTVEQRLARAQESIERARARMASGEVTIDGRFGWASTSDLSTPHGRLPLWERGGGKKRGRSSGRGGTGCTPGDPLCGDVDGWGGEEGEEEDEPEDPLAVNLPVPAATPKPPPRPPREGKLDRKPKPLPLPGPAAARVSHAQAPQGVARAVARHHGQLVACLPQALRSSGLRLRVRARLDAQGAFREPRVLATDIDPQVAACIVDRFRQMRVAGYDRGSRMITVPLWLGSDP